MENRAIDRTSSELSRYQNFTSDTTTNKTRESIRPEKSKLDSVLDDINTPIWKNVATLEQNHTKYAPRDVQDCDARINPDDLNSKILQFVARQSLVTPTGVMEYEAAEEIIRDAYKKLSELVEKYKDAMSYQVESKINSSNGNSMQTANSNSDSDKVSVQHSNQTTLNSAMLSILSGLAMVRAIAQSSYELANNEQQQADTLSMVLGATSQSYEAYTKQLDQEYKEIQHKIDQIKKKYAWLSFLGPSVDVLIIALLAATCPAVAAVVVPILVCDMVVRGYAAVEMAIDSDNVDNSALNRLNTYGLVGLAIKDDNTAEIVENVVMGVIMIAGFVFGIGEAYRALMAAEEAAQELLMATLKQMMTEAIQAPLRAGAASLIRVLSMGVGAGISAKKTIESFYKEKSKTDEMSAEDAAAYGGIQGLIALLIEKSGLREKIVEGLSTFMAEDSAKMTEEISETLYYMVLAGAQQMTLARNAEAAAMRSSKGVPGIDAASKVNNNSGKLEEMAENTKKMMKEFLDKLESMLETADPEQLAILKEFASKAGSAALYGMLINGMLTLVTSTPLSIYNLLNTKYMKEGSANEQLIMTLMQSVNDTMSAWSAQLQEMEQRTSDTTNSVLDTRQAILRNINQSFAQIRAFDRK